MVHFADLTSAVRTSVENQFGPEGSDMIFNNNRAAQIVSSSMETSKYIPEVRRRIQQELDMHGVSKQETLTAADVVPSLQSAMQHYDDMPLLGTLAKIQSHVEAIQSELFDIDNQIKIALQPPQAPGLAAAAGGGGLGLSTAATDLGMSVAFGQTGAMMEGKTVRIQEPPVAASPGRARSAAATAALASAAQRRASAVHNMQSTANTLSNAAGLGKTFALTEVDFASDSSNKQQQQQLTSVQSTGTASTKPTLVLALADLKFEGFKDSGPTSLPAKMDAEEVLTGVCNAFLMPRESDRDRWLSIIAGAESQDFLKDMFWYWFCEYFQKDGTQADQAKLFNRIAESYVKIFLSTPHRLKDELIARYHECMAQAVYTIFHVTFPESRDQFDNGFTENLSKTLAHWCTGAGMKGAESRHKWTSRLDAVLSELQAARVMAEDVENSTSLGAAILLDAASQSTNGINGPRAKGLIGPGETNNILKGNPTKVPQPPKTGRKVGGPQQQQQQQQGNAQVNSGKAGDGGNNNNNNVGGGSGLLRKSTMSTAGWANATSQAAAAAATATGAQQQQNTGGSTPPAGLFASTLPTPPPPATFVGKRQTLEHFLKEAMDAMSSTTANPTLGTPGNSGSNSGGPPSSADSQQKGGLLGAAMLGAKGAAAAGAKGKESAWSTVLAGRVAPPSPGGVVVGGNVTPATSNVPGGSAGSSAGGMMGPMTADSSNGFVYRSGGGNSTVVPRLTLPAPEDAEENTPAAMSSRQRLAKRLEKRQQTLRRGCETERGRIPESMLDSIDMDGDDEYERPLTVREEPVSKKDDMASIMVKFDMVSNSPLIRHWLALHSSNDTRISQFTKLLRANILARDGGNDRYYASKTVGGMERQKKIAKHYSEVAKQHNSRVKEIRQNLTNQKRELDAQFAVMQREKTTQGFSNWLVASQMPPIMLHGWQKLGKTSVGRTGE